MQGGPDYAVLEETADIERQVAERELPRVLPHDVEHALAMGALLEAVKAERTMVQDVLKDWTVAGVVLRVGAGKKGDAYRYYLPQNSPEKLPPGETVEERNSR